MTRKKNTPPTPNALSAKSYVWKTNNIRNRLQKGETQARLGDGRTRSGSVLMTGMEGAQP
jgi:hypothetical protein